MATIPMWRQNGRCVRPIMDENISSVLRKYNLYGQPDSLRKCSSIQAARSRENRNMHCGRIEWSDTTPTGKVQEKNKMLFKIDGNAHTFCKNAHNEKE